LRSKDYRDEQLRVDDVIPGNHSGIPGGNANEDVNGSSKEAIIPEYVAEDHQGQEKAQGRAGQIG
jgi:hypothetical protein